MSSKLMIGPTGDGRTSDMRAPINAALPETALWWVYEPVNGASTMVHMDEGFQATAFPKGHGFGDGQATSCL